jgi:4-hydroxymandelate oxidase
MDYKEVLSAAKEKMKGYCRVCPQCNGIACAGEVPGMGGVGTGEAFKENIRALSKAKIVLRTIHEATNPDMSTNLLNKDMKAPIYAAPITGGVYNMGGALSEKEYADSVVKACDKLGLSSMIGDGADPAMYQSGLTAIEEAGGNGIAIIKPRENEAIIENINLAEQKGCLAVGIDIDGAGLVTMALKGQPVGPKSKDDLKQIISKTDLPFILKGIMTVDEALAAVEVGAKAIIVSNHGGRILDCTQGSAQVLPEIAKAVKGKITILVDGGVRSGVDVFKYLALGADGVLIGRPVIIAAYGGYQQGVEIYMSKIMSELKQTMILTGCNSIQDIDSSKIFIQQ